MKIIRNSVLPVGKNFGAINLFGVLFVKPDMRITPDVINHEMIHTAQMKELGYVFFYIIYVAEWIVRLFASRGNPFTAYRSISFEQEAYRYQSRLQYLSGRPRFAQWRKSGGRP